MKENIEEDIRILEHIKMGIKADTQAPNVHIRNVAMRKFEAIEHILSDYKRLQEAFEQVDHECFRLEQKELMLEKEVELAKEALKKQCDIADERNQLLKENEELKRLIAHKNGYTQQLEKDLFENCDNYVISKQKIKDKIEELEDKIQELSDEQGYWGDNELLVKIQVLQDLLEEKGE